MSHCLLSDHVISASISKSGKWGKSTDALTHDANTSLHIATIPHVIGLLTAHRFLLESADHVNPKFCGR